MFMLTRKFAFDGKRIINGETQSIEKHCIKAGVTFGCESLNEDYEIFDKGVITCIISALLEKISHGMFVNSDQYIAIHENLKSFVPDIDALVNIGNVDPTFPNITKYIFKYFEDEIDLLDVVNDPFVVCVEIEQFNKNGLSEKYIYGA